MVRIKQILAALALCVLSTLAYAPVVQAGAQQSSSANYGVSEVNFGSGGDVNVCSTNYCSRQSAGELSVGNTASTNYQAQAGFNTNREEFLSVSVAGGTINLGNLTTAAPKFGSTTFSVSSYLASGYAVTIAGVSPTNSSNGHLLAGMSSPDISRPGSAEQFGINLKANTTPAVGANEQQSPDSTFSFGAAATGYNTANTFKFVPGDVIAQSTKSSGTTTFTMSMIENITTSTPSGVYKGNLDVIVTPSF